MTDDRRPIGGGPDPLWRAMADHQRGDSGSLVYRDGERTREDSEVTSNFAVGEIIEEPFSNGLL